MEDKKVITDQKIKTAILEWLADVRGNRKIDKIIDVNNLQNTKAEEETVVTYSLERGAKTVVKTETHNISLKE